MPWQIRNPGDPLLFLPLPVAHHMTLKEQPHVVFFFPLLLFFCFDYEVFHVIASSCLYKICICITSHTTRPWSQLGLPDMKVMKRHISKFSVFQCPLWVFCNQHWRFYCVVLPNDTEQRKVLRGECWLILFLAGRTWAASWRWKRN